MYPIDLNTCTALDIIKRSVTCHPTLFRDALLERRREDYAYASKRDGRVADGAYASGRAAQRAVDHTDGNDIEAFKLDMGAGIIALGIACKLQCIPAHVRTASALRTWPQAD